MSQHNTPEIARSAGPAGYRAARTGVAIADRRDRGRLLVSGADRASYLQGMLTNDMTALGPGRGCYACYLTAQGRMISDMWVFETGDAMLMTLPRTTREVVLARLEQFVFSEDVQLVDVTGSLGSVAVMGPQAPAAIASVASGLSPESLAALPVGGNLRSAADGQPVIVLRAGDAGVDAYELVVDAGRFETAWTALAAAGAEAAPIETVEALRIEGGIPRFHQDMDEETIPLEAGLEDTAISQQKGCYVGQEVIIRVLHRGHGRVARRLVGFACTGEAAPAVGAIVRTPDREIGRVTSAVMSPALGTPIALGYVHRDFTTAGTAVTIDGVPATVTTLPFVP